MRGASRTRRVPETLVGLTWISPWIIGFLAFMALPVALSVYYSLTDYTILEPPIWTGLENYRAMAHDPTFWVVVKNTVWYAALSIPIGTVLAVLIAALLNQPVKGLGFFRAAVFVPTMVPIVASAMIWLWLFNGEYGLINQVLGLVGVTGPNWLGDKIWAMPAIVLISFWGVGQAVVIYLAAMQDVPRQLYEAASLDGVGATGRFWHVTLPGISPVILFNVIIAIIGTWQVFALPYLMTQGGPDRATYFYSMYLYDNAFVFYGKMGYACAMSWVQFMIILALTGLTFLVSRRLVHYRFA